MYCLWGRGVIMSRLLEILGCGFTVRTADLMCDWLNRVHADKQNSPAEGLTEIIELLSEKKLQAAEEKLRFHLFENPSCTKGRMAAAAICLQKNQLDDAIEALQSIYLREPANTMALYALGHCHERLGNEAQAVEFYQDCLKFKRHLRLPGQRLAAIYFKNSQLEKAIQQYQLLISEYPDDTSSLVSLGHLYLASQQYTHAIEAFNNAILMHPDNFRGDEYDDNLDSMLGDERIRETIEQLRSQVPERGEGPYFNLKLADLLATLGEDSEAVLYYEKAIEIQPNSLLATIKLGTHHLRADRHSAAAEQFSRAVEINDQIVEAYLGLAVGQKLAGSADQAGQTLALAWSIQQNTTLLFSQATALEFNALCEQSLSFGDRDHRDGALDSVLAAHEKQLSARGSNNADVHYRYGLLLMAKSRLPQAITAFAKALTANPTFHRANCKLAICLYEQGSKEQALQRLSNPKALDKDILELHYKTALLYCNRAHFAVAVGQLQEKLTQQFAESDASANLEVVLQNLGLVDRAMITWQHLTESAHNAIGHSD